MSDDIDIEEHDVMAGLAKKDVFVDLSIVKREVLDIEYEESMPDTHRLKPPSPQMIAACSVEVHNADSTTDDIPEPPATLESPLTVCSSDHIETSTTNQDVECDHHDDDDDYEKLKEEAKSNVTKVMLEDWGSYIRQCKSYCEHCDILFPTENALAAHDMSSHSYLVAVEGSNAVPSSTQIPVLPSDPPDLRRMASPARIMKRQGDLFKCLYCYRKFNHRQNARRHYFNVHQFQPAYAENYTNSNISVSNRSISYSRQVSQGETFQTVEKRSDLIHKNSFDVSHSSSNTCQLCGEFFINKDLLLNHLYEKHFPTKSYTCEKCDSTFPTNALLMQHACNCVKNQRDEYKTCSNVNQWLKPQDTQVPKCFRCNICFSYYLVETNVLRHMSYYHKQYLKTVPKELIVDKINLTCPFCSDCFNYCQYYNKHIKDKHPEKLSALHPDRSFKPELVDKKMENHLMPYQRNLHRNTGLIVQIHNGYRCSLCLKVFSKYQTAYSHRVRSHANVKKCVISKSRKIEKVESPERIESGVLLPINVIYKCPKCKIYSTSVFDTESHIEKHNLDTDCMNTKKCDKCNLHFTLSSIKNHLKQHDFSQNFSHIIVEKTDAFKERVLHKCSKCLIHFSESSLKKHYWSCGYASVKSNLCTKCNIMIEYNSYFYHKKYHQCNLTDMVIVNYMHIDKFLEKDVRRWRFFYCERCECYITNTEARFSTHQTGKCLKFEKDICPFCGLMLPLPALSYHMKFHETIEEMSFENYDFYNNIGPSGKIYPPPPSFPKCDQCDVHFESLIAQRTHICSDVDIVSCQYCGIKLTGRAHTFHLYYHNYCNKKMPVKSFTSRGNVEQKQKLDILFLCNNCNVAVDKYDDLVKHCQNQQLGLLGNTMLCDVCDLNFDELCYDRHMRRHVRADVARSDFRIIEFSEDEFFRSNWFSSFFVKDSGAIAHVLEEAVSTSIHKRVKYVKLHLHKNGKPNCVLYQCGYCHTLVNRDFVFRHTLKYMNGSCRQQIKCQCNICNFKCIGTLSLKLHKTEFDHSENNYRLVRFNCPEDRDYNIKLIGLYKNNAPNKPEISDNFPYENETMIAFEQKEQSMNYSGVYENSTITDEKTSDTVKYTNKRTYKMYQCRKCNIVLNTRNSCLRHSRANCGKKVNLIKCKKCDLQFGNIVWIKHLAYHRKFKDLKKSNITLFTFYKDGAKIKISLQNPTLDSIEMPQNENKPLYEGHVIDRANKYPFYQCKNCGICVTSSHGARKHTTLIYNCKGMKKKMQKCPICGLKFYMNLSSHMQMHDDHRDMNRKTIKVIPFGDKNDTEDSDSCSDELLQNSEVNGAGRVKRYFLYRCTECDLCVSTKEGMRLHRSIKPHPPIRTYKKCDLCQCKFSRNTWHNHMKNHRIYSDYVIDNISVIPYGPKSKPVEEMATAIEYVEDQDNDVEDEGNEVVDEENEIDALSGNETDIDSQTNISVVSQSSTKLYKIYKCTKCGLYLNTKYTVHHHITKSNAMEYKTCEICNFIFTPKSFLFHMKQHEKPNYTVDNIEIVDFDETTVSSEGTPKQNSLIDNTDQSMTSSMQNELKENDHVIYKCMKCDLCVKTMSGAYKHIYYSSHLKIEGRECPSCNYKFAPNSFTVHEKMHAKYKDYTVDNIKVIGFDKKPISGGIIINNVYYKEIYPGRSLASEKPPEKCPVMPKKYIIYQCSECKIYTYTKKHVYSHRHSISGNKTFCPYYCKLCSLNFSYKSYVAHYKMHRKYKDYNIKNIEIVTISPKSNGNSTRNHHVDSQSHQKYLLYKCVKCDYYMHSRKCVNFHFKMRHRHTHGYRTCSMCEYKFSKKGWLIHDRLHKRFKNYIKENIKIVNVYREPKAGLPIPCHANSAAVPTKITELQKFVTPKFTLFKCAQCQLCLNTKKSAISHNKRGSHLRSNILTHHCKYCNCAFHKKSLNMHMKLHRTYKDFVYENIKFIEFGKKDPADCRTRNVKSIVPLEAKKFFIYKCRVCHLCFHSEKGAYVHTNRKVHTTVSSHCKICSFTFPKMGMFHHKLMHRRYKTFSKANITIIDFGENTNTHKDGSNDEVEERLQVDANEDVGDDLHQDGHNESNKIVLYKCRACGLCVQSYRGAEIHTAQNANHSSYGNKICKHCGYKFSKKGIYSHLLVHKKFKNYTNDLIQVVEFGAEAAPVESDSRKRKHDDCTDSASLELLEKKARLFKCSCGLHFLKESTIEKHLRVCGKDDKITKQSCSRCGLEFTAESLFSHLCTHHGNSKYKYKYDIINMSPSAAKEHIMLYKCMKCNTHFLGLTNAKRHFSCCKGIESSNIARECEKCGLYFHMKVLLEHQMYHHTLTKNLISYEYKVIDVSDSCIDNSDSTINSLYKCLACSIYFLKKSSIAEHVNIPHSTKMDLKTLDCRMCNLTFTFRALPAHRRMHHETYNIEEFEIHEYDSVSKMEVAMKKHSVENAAIEDTTSSDLIEPSKEDSTSKIDDLLEETCMEVITTKEKKKEVSNILYKCSDCNVHYLKESTVYKHTIKNHQRIHPTDIFECKHCGLNFRALTLTPHTRQHHYDNDFQLRDFIIHEYEPLTRAVILKNRKSTPRVTIYNAADGLRNDDPCDKLDEPHESPKEINPPMNIEDLHKIDPVESLHDLDENTEDEKPNDKEFTNDTNIEKVNDDTTSYDKDCSVANCEKDDVIDTNLDKSAMEVETNVGEKSIRNFIIFES